MIAAVTATEPQERTSLLALLNWAFQRQKAHRTDDSDGFGLRLGSPRDSCAKIEEIGALMGCRIDGGQWKEIGHRVHPDASTVVEAVRRLPTAWSALVWQHACAGTVPDWGEDAAFYPVLRSNGKHTVNTATLVVGDRKGRRSETTVSWCPVELRPDPEYCREEWRLWYSGLVVLKAIMPARPTTGKLLKDMEPDAREEFFARIHRQYPGVAVPTSLLLGGGRGGQ